MAKGYKAYFRTMEGLRRMLKLKDAARAVQVADRFHLLVNLRDAFQKSLRKHFKVIKDSFQEFSAENEVAQDGKENPNNNKITDYKSSGTEKTEIRGQDTNSLFSGNVSLEKQYKFQRSKELHKKGYSIKAIANQLGAGRKTIRKYIATEKLKSREIPISKSFTNFSSFESELIRLFSSKTTLLSLFDHIVGLGFNGKYTQFCERMNMLINDGHNAKTREKNLLPAL